MKYLKKILEFIGFLVLFSTVIIGARIGYNYYKELKAEKAELNYYTKVKWKWHNKSNRIQIHSDGEGLSLLRKVYTNEKRIIYAWKNMDYSLTTTAVFIADCKPNSVIKTSQNFRNGNPKVLKCSEKGDMIAYEVTWNGDIRTLIWEEKLNGMKFNEDFRFWGFSVLDQEIALSKAK